MILNLFDSDHFHMMEWWYNIFGSYWGFFMALGGIIYFIIGTIIAYYIHRDAVENQIPNAELWFIVIIVFNFIGLLLYLLIRGNYFRKSKFSNVDIKKD